MEGKALLVIILMVFFIVFASQNSTDTSITFIKWQTPEIPLVIVLLASLVVGMVISYLFGVVKKLQMRQEIKELKKQIEAQDEELKSLRTLSLFSPPQGEDLTEQIPPREPTDNDSV